MLFPVQLFCAVMEQGGPAGGLPILPPAAGQGGGSPLRTQHMGNPPVAQHGHRHAPQILQGQVLQVRPRAVEPLPQDIAIDRRGKKCPPLPAG